MNRISAFFTDNARAQSVALSLSEKKETNDVTLKNINNRGIYHTNYAFSCALIGAVAGLILLNVAFSFSATDVFYRLSFLPGVLAGAVIGAISGAFSDIFAKENVNELIGISVATDNDTALTIKELRRRGAIQLYLEK